MQKYCNHCMYEMEDTMTVCPMCGKEDNIENVPAHHLLPGTILNNKFYVGRAIGEGGFGITYIGRDVKLDMKVAIKEFYPNGCVTRNNTVSLSVANSVTDDRKDIFETGKDRFLKEARVLARFSGEPGIVWVRDFFEEKNTAYIIMEYLDGINLKEFLKKNGRLSAQKTVELMMPVMMSLKKVHAQGMIHRDISPDNIMLIGNRVKLLDFGAARNVSASDKKSLSIMLKPGYAPEEQYRSKGNQGPWTDVYALCATMYKCITGITPDDATQRVFSDEVKAPSEYGISIPKHIENAIMRGMSVHQKDRFQNIDELIEQLNNSAPVSADNAKTISATNVAMATNRVNSNYYVPSPYPPQPAVNNHVQYTPVPQRVPVVPTQPQTPPKKKSKAGIIIGVVIGVSVLVMAVVAILFALGIIGDDNSNRTSSDEKITKAPTTELSTEKVTENPPYTTDFAYTTQNIDIAMYDQDYNYLGTENHTIEIPNYDEYLEYYYSLETVGLTVDSASATLLSTGYYEIELFLVDSADTVALDLLLFYNSDNFTVENMFANQITLGYIYEGESTEYVEMICFDENMQILYSANYIDDVLDYSFTVTGYSCLSDVYYNSDFEEITVEEYDEEVGYVLSEIENVVYG